jgi:parvulin-like peptidyl-prolyl isomerase
VRRFWLAVFLACAAATATGQHTPQGEGILARAGARFITEREFRERFELLPGLYRHRGAGLEVTKLEFLYMLAAEKLLAQEAATRGLDRDSAFLAGLDGVRRLLARDQLYREEVRQSVTVTPADIAAGIRQAPVLLHVAYLYFGNEADARFVRGRIGSAREFDLLVPDSSLGALRDTATVIWGDAAEEIESAAYALGADEVSPPVRSGDGWYLLRVLSRSPRPDYSGLDPAALRERVEEVIRARRESVRMHEVLREVLSRTQGYGKAAAVKALGAALRDLFSEDAAAGGDSMVALDAGGAERLRAAMSARLTDTLAVAGATIWSVADGINLLLSRRFAVRRDRLDAVPAMINDELEFRVHQELLAQEGLRRGLDARPEVRSRLELWRDAYLADAMKQEAFSRVTMTDAELAEYAQYLDSSAAPPEVNLRELRTASLGEMEEALAALESGATFEDVVRRWTSDEALRRTGGETGFFPITARAPVGPLAGELRVGERFGPVRTDSGVVVFEVLGRRDAPPPAGSALPPKDSLAASLRAIKQQGLLNRFLSQAAARQGVDVYEDRLRAVDVSPLPMLTYRLLGFGGRMFEVPFVDPQIHWLRIPPPQDPVIP